LPLRRDDREGRAAVRDPFDYAQGRLFLRDDKEGRARSGARDDASIRYHVGYEEKFA